MLLEIISYCAVDGFALISGYVANNKPQKYSKIVEMWFQVFFYSFILSVVLTAFGLNDELRIKNIIKSVLPVTFNRYWYFTAYFGLFFAIPLLNRFLFSVDDADAKRTLIVLIALFSVLGIATDPFKTHRGYSLLWLMVLYCIGVLAKRIKLFEKKRTSTLILLWLICILGTWVIRVFAGIGRVVNYVSPPILMSGLLMVLLFSRLKLKGTIIAKLSPLAFGIYLFQLNRILWDNVIENAFVFVSEKNPAVGVGYVFLIASGIFLAGLLVEWLRVKMAKLLMIPELSKKLASGVEKTVEKLFVLLR